MKNFTKPLMILLLSAITFQSVAQIDFGLRIGANFSKQLYKADFDGLQGFEDLFEEFGDIDGMKMLPGGNLGFVFDIDINAPVSIETGMLLNTKGYRAKNDKYKESVYLVYVDVPINAKYTFDLNGPKFYVTAGPYLAFGVLGKGTSFEEDGDETIRNEWDYTWGKKEFFSHKRIDLGLSIGCGFQFGGFVIGANYGHGLLNISTIDFLKIKNRCLSVSIGTNFGG